MAVFASDTFNSHTNNTYLVGKTPVVGGTWTDGSGNGSAPSPLCETSTTQHIRQHDAATSIAYINTAASSADYTVSVDVHPQSGGCGGVGGVAGRKVAGAGTGATYTLYWADYYDHATAGSRVWRLYKVVSGAFTALNTDYTENIGTTTKTLTLSMVGSSIKLLVDGVERVTATDSAITAAGYAGVILGAASSPSTNAVYLDNFVASTVSPSPALARRRPSGLYVR